jgi:hypothetical protein
LIKNQYENFYFTLVLFSNPIILLIILLKPDHRYVYNMNPSIEI